MKRDIATDPTHIRIIFKKILWKASGEQLWKFSWWIEHNFGKMKLTNADTGRNRKFE